MIVWVDPLCGRRRLSGRELCVRDLHGRELFARHIDVWILCDANDEQNR